MCVRTLQAARHIKIPKTVVHNFVSATNLYMVGGGVKEDLMHTRRMSV